MAQRLPVLAALKSSAPHGGSIANRELVVAVAKILGFVAIGYILYGRRTRINDYNDDALADDDGWDWDFIDCWYFTMATLTTVGYGDMPTLSQYMRGITSVFGLVGVLVIANSLGVIADWFVERARKRFIQQQRGLLKEAEAVGQQLRHTQAGEEDAGEKALSPEQSGKPDTGRGDGAGNGAGLSPATPSAHSRPAPPLPLAPVVPQMPAGSPAPSPPPSPGGPGVALATPSKQKASRGMRSPRVAPSPVPSASERGGGKRNRRTDARLKFAREVCFALAPCLLLVGACIGLGEIENANAEGCSNSFTNLREGSEPPCWTFVDSLYCGRAVRISAKHLHPAH